MPYFVPILNIKPMGFADGSVWNASEGKESRKSPQFLGYETKCDCMLGSNRESSDRFKVE